MNTAATPPMASLAFRFSRQGQPELPEALCGLADHYNELCLPINKYLPRIVNPTEEHMSASHIKRLLDKK